MKKTAIFITILFSTFLLLVACSDVAEQNTNDNKLKENKSLEAGEDSEGNNDLNEGKDEKEEAENMLKLVGGEADNESSNSIPSKINNVSNMERNASINSSKDEENDVLSQYTVGEIKYARVWLQLGVNQDLDELHVEYISKGTPLNPDDETSMDYPEDVIQLSGTRLVDGVITYSGNGDGTINVYNVPKRWDGKNPAGEDVYKKIIEGIVQEFIDTGDDEKVEELIKIMTVNS